MVKDRRTLDKMGTNAWLRGDIQDRLIDEQNNPATPDVPLAGNRRDRRHLASLERREKRKAKKKKKK